MNENNEPNVTIEFFDRIKNIIPTKDDGTVDLDKYIELLFDGDKDDPTLKFIYSKIPEYFARGSTVFTPLSYFALEPNDGEKPYDAQLMEKITKGDFSDIKKYEQLYPCIHELASFLNKGFFGLNYYINKSLWHSGKIIPDSLKEPYEKYHDIYDEIVKNEGGFKYKGEYVHTKDKIEKLLAENSEDKELLEFASRIIRGYKISKNKDAFRRFDKKSYEKDKESLKLEFIKVKQLEEDLKATEDELKKFGAIKSIFNRAKKQELIEKRDKISKDLNFKRRGAERFDKELNELEEDREFIDLYKEKYIEEIDETIIPKVKIVIDKNYPQEEQQVYKDLLENFRKNFLTKEKIEELEAEPFEVACNVLSSIANKSFDHYMDKFNNAITTAATLPSAIVDFENSPDKDLFSLLNIIREKLGNTPIDADHGKLENVFRKQRLKDDTSSFMGVTEDVSNIEIRMGELNKEFVSILNEENIEEYIKKCGIIWHKFIMCHPYEDGNGRTGRYLINAMLAHKGIAIPSLYNSWREQVKLIRSMDKCVVDVLNPDYDELGSVFLESVRGKTIDLTGEDRLNNKNKNKDKKHEDIEAKL